MPKANHKLAEVLKAVQTVTSDCVLWTSATNALGYGKLTVAGVDWLAHRLSFLLKNGSVPDLLRHTCDTPGCINPAHLIPGTSQENMDDMVSRARQCKGEARATKLTQADVDWIKANHVPGTSRWNPGNGRKIAHRFSVSVDFIRDIVGGRKWKTS